HEFESSLKKSWKIRIIFIIFLIPFLTMWLLPQTIQNQDVERFLTINRMLNYFGIANFDFLSFFSLILLIIISSELIAKEIEENTLQLLIIKPINRSDILIGKILSIFVPIFSLYSLTILLHLIDFHFKFAWSLETFISHLFLTWFPIILVAFLGFGTVVVVTVLFSLLFSRSVYGVLAALVVFIGNDLFFFNNPDFRFSYQLGVIVEEFLPLEALSVINLYQSSDPLLIIVIIISILITTFNLSLLALYRREFS
ncbi:hypothetical protein LCGC14_2856130, partial [marine sediment metagenome]